MNLHEYIDIPLKKVSIPKNFVPAIGRCFLLDCLKSGRLKVAWNDEDPSGEDGGDRMVSRVYTGVGEIEAQFRRHGRTNGLDLIPTLMLRQATIHFAPTNRLDPVPVLYSLSVYLSICLSISISVKDWDTR